MQRDSLSFDCLCSFLVRFALSFTLVVSWQFSFLFQLERFAFGGFLLLLLQRHLLLLRESLFLLALLVRCFDALLLRIFANRLFRERHPSPGNSDAPRRQLGNFISEIFNPGSENGLLPKSCSRRYESLPRESAGELST